MKRFFVALAAVAVFGVTTPDLACGSRAADGDAVAGI